MKRNAVAAAMVVATLGWASWLFGAADWARALDGAELTFEADAGLPGLIERVERVDAQTKKTAMAIQHVYEPDGEASREDRREGRDPFFGRVERTQESPQRSLTAQTKTTTAKPAEAKKVEPFPVERFRLTGLIMGERPKAFVYDEDEKKSKTVAAGSRLANGTVASITESGVTVQGEFGTAVIARK